MKNMNKFSNAARLFVTMLTVCMGLMVVLTPRLAQAGIVAPTTVSCLKGDAVVTCGKVAGTFDVTLNLGGSGGVIPTTAQISVLTPGVTIVSPASSYPVIGGKVKITLAGATPGQVVDFQMDGSSTTPDPKTGLSICCNGKISITIPKDLDCNPKSTIDITKICDPAVYRKYPTKPNVTAAGYVSICHITVKTTGPQTTTLSVNDNLAGGTIVSAASTTAPPWVCAGSACTVNGNTLNQTVSTSNIDVMVVFPTTGAVTEGKNCAVVASDGKDVDKDCTTFTVAEKGKLTVIKEASYNGNHITNVNFPIAVTCGGTTTNGTFADGTPYVQTNIPVGTNCSVVEGATPATGLCNKSQSEVWTTTYNPTTPVVATVAGATIKVRNVLTCKSDKSTIKVEKVCAPAKEVAGAINHFEAMCKITVTTTGAQTALIVVNEAMSGGGIVTSAASSTTPAWNCNTANCSINGGALNQTASSSVIDVKVSFPSKGHVLESQNCARLSVGQYPVPKPNGESCTKFSVEEVKKGKITILKEALFNGGHITTQSFPIAVTCGGATTNATISDGKPYVQTGLPLNASCSVVEGITTPAAGLCNKGQIGTWVTTYNPATAVAASVAGGAITITNRLDCKRIDPVEGKTTFSVQKEASYNGEPITDIVFPMNVTCDNSSVQTLNVRGGQSQTIGDLPAGTTCSVVEGDIPNAGLCPKGTTEQWVTSYSPENASNTTSANSSVVVRVKNQLSCRKIVVDAPKCDGVTAQPGKDGSCVCLYRNMSKTSSASCGCAKGNKFIKGKGCVPIEPVCKNGTKFNPARGRCEPICQKGQTYNLKSNRCDTPRPVCKRNEQFNPKTGKCVAVSKDPVCRAPFKYNAKINKCVEVVQNCPRGTAFSKGECRPVKRNSCPFPLVPTPLGCVDPGAVIDLFGGGGRPRDNGGDPGPGTPSGGDQSAYCKQNPGRCP